MSAYEKTGDWKSPRKIEEDIRLYRRKRFEYFMELEDIGLLSRELALTAFREELEQPTYGVDSDETEDTPIL